MLARKYRSAPCEAIFGHNFIISVVSAAVIKWGSCQTCAKLACAMKLARWLSPEPAAGIIIRSSLELRCREQTINSCFVSSRDPAYTRATLPSLYMSSDESLESSPRLDLTIAAVSRDTSEVFERCGMTKIKIVLSASPPSSLSLYLPLCLSSQWKSWSGALSNTACSSLSLCALDEAKKKKDKHTFLELFGWRIAGGGRRNVQITKLCSETES